MGNSLQLRRLNAYEEFFQIKRDYAVVAHEYGSKSLKEFKNHAKTLRWKLKPRTFQLTV